jgi:hypothetical protein
MKLNDIPILIKLEVRLEENSFYASPRDRWTSSEKSSIRHRAENIIFEPCRNIRCPHIFYRELDLDLIAHLKEG